MQPPPATGRGEDARGATEALRAIIRRIEARHRAAPAARPVTLEALLGGEEEDTPDGPILVVRRRYPAAHRHGVQALGAARGPDPDTLALLARAQGPAPEARRLAYLDTETTGLAGGTGTYAFLVGVGFFDDEAFEVRQYFLRDLDEEPRLLAALARLLPGFGGLVTYNGAMFDLPLLETRFVLGRCRWPGEIFHLDLLPPSRRLWRWHLDDCRLGTVEQHAVGFARGDDIPGALIPAVYFDYLRRRASGPLPRVFEHNRNDILSLVALTGRVATWLAAAPEGDLGPLELAGLGQIWEPRDPERGQACYRRALDLGVESPWRERLLTRLASREKRQMRWEEARALWAAVAREQRGFDPRPWEEVAKIDEHRRRDPGGARVVVQEALGLARAHGASAPVLASLTHRLARLERRLAVPSARSPDGPSRHAGARPRRRGSSSRADGR
jgi:hypothetical protein